MAEFNAGSIEASLELNRDAFIAGLTAAQQQAASFERNPITAVLELNTEKLFTSLQQASVQAQTQASANPITVPLQATPDLASVGTARNTMQGAVRDLQARLVATPLVGSVATALAALRERITPLTVQLRAQANLTSVADAEAEMRRAAGSIEVPMKGKADIASVVAEQAVMQAVVEHTLHVKLKAEADMSSVEAAEEAEQSFVDKLSLQRRRAAAMENFAANPPPGWEVTHTPPRSMGGRWSSLEMTNPETQVIAQMFAPMVLRYENAMRTAMTTVEALQRAYKDVAEPMRLNFAGVSAANRSLYGSYQHPLNFPGGEFEGRMYPASSYPGVMKITSSALERNTAAMLRLDNSITAGHWTPANWAVPMPVPTVVHEYGHLLDYQRRGEFGQAWPTNAPGFATPSGYGATNPTEAYAESFLEHQLTGGETTKMMPRLLAHAEGWRLVPEIQALIKQWDEILAQNPAEVALQAYADIPSVLKAQAEEQAVVEHTIHIPAVAYAILESVVRAQEQMNAAFKIIEGKVELAPGTSLQDLKANVALFPDLASVTVTERVLERQVVDLISHLKAVPDRESVAPAIATLAGLTHDLGVTVRAGGDISTVPTALARLASYIGVLQAELAPEANTQSVPAEKAKLESAVAAGGPVEMPIKTVADAEDIKSTIADAATRTTAPKVPIKGTLTVGDVKGAIDDAEARANAAAQARPVRVPITFETEQLRQAAELIIAQQDARIATVQQRLGTTQSEATRLLTQLHEIGVVGPTRPGRARQVLMTAMPDTESIPRTFERLGNEVAKVARTRKVRAPVELDFAIPAERLAELQRSKALNVALHVTPELRKAYSPEAIRWGQAANLRDLGIPIDASTLEKVIQGEYQDAIAKAIRGAYREAQKKTTITQTTTTVTGGKVVYEPVIAKPTETQVSEAADILAHAWERVKLPVGITIPEGNIANAAIAARKLLEQHYAVDEPRLRAMISYMVDPNQVQDAFRTADQLAAGQKIVSPIIAGVDNDALIQAYNKMRTSLEQGNIGGVPLRELRGKLGVLPDLQSVPEALLALQNLLKQLVTYLIVKPELGSVPGATADLQTVADSEEVKVQTVTAAKLTSVIATIQALQNEANRDKDVKVAAVTDAVTSSVLTSVETLQKQANRQDVTVGMVTSEVAGTVFKTVQGMQTEAKKYKVEIAAELEPESGTVDATDATLQQEATAATPIVFPAEIGDTTTAVTDADVKLTQEAAKAKPVAFPADITGTIQAVTAAVTKMNGQTPDVKFPADITGVTQAVAAADTQARADARAARPIDFPMAIDVQLPDLLRSSVYKAWREATTKKAKLDIVAELVAKGVVSSVGPAKSKLQAAATKAGPIDLKVQMQGVLDQDALRKQLSSAFSFAGLAAAAKLAGLKGASSFDTKTALLDAILKSPSMAEAIVGALPLKVKPTLDTDALQKLINQAKGRLTSLSNLQVRMVLGPESVNLKNQIKGWQTQLNEAQNQLDVGVKIQPGDLADIMAKVQATKTAIDKESANIKLGVSLDPDILKTAAGGKGGGKGSGIGDLGTALGFGGAKLFGFFGPGVLPKAGTAAGLALGGQEHLIILGAAIVGSFANAVIGASTLALGGASVVAVGVGNALASTGQAVGDLQKVVTAQQQLNAAAQTWGKNSQQYLSAWQNFATVLQTQVNPYVQPGLYKSAATQVLALQDAFDKFTGPAESTSLVTITASLKDFTSSGYLSTLGSYAELSSKIVQNFLLGHTQASKATQAADDAAAKSATANFNKLNAIYNKHPTAANLKAATAALAEMNAAQAKAVEASLPTSGGFLQSYLLSDTTTQVGKFKQFGGLALFQELEKLATSNEGSALQALGNFFKLLGDVVGYTAPQTTGMLKSLEDWLAKTAMPAATPSAIKAQKDDLAALTAAYHSHDQTLNGHKVTLYDVLAAQQKLADLLKQGSAYASFMSFIQNSISVFHEWANLIFAVVQDIGALFSQDKKSKVWVFDPQGQGKLVQENLNTTGGLLQDITGMLKDLNNWMSGAQTNKVFPTELVDQRTGAIIKENLSAAQATPAVMAALLKAHGVKPGDLLAYTIFDPKTGKQLAVQAGITGANLVNSFASALTDASKLGGQPAIQRIFDVRRNELLNILNTFPPIISALGSIAIPVMIAGGTLISNIAAGVSKILSSHWGGIPSGQIISYAAALAILIRTLRLGTVGGVSLLAVGVGFSALVGPLTQLLGIKETKGEQTVIEYLTVLTGLLVILNKLKYASTGKSILQMIFGGLTTKPRGEGGILTAKFWKDLFGIGTGQKLTTATMNVDAATVNINGPGEPGKPGGGGEPVPTALKWGGYGSVGALLAAPEVVSAIVTAGVLATTIALIALAPKAVATQTQKDIFNQAFKALAPQQQRVGETTLANLTQAQLAVLIQRASTTPGGIQQLVKAIGAGDTYSQLLKLFGNALTRPPVGPTQPAKPVVPPAGKKETTTEAQSVISSAAQSFAEKLPFKDWGVTVQQINQAMKVLGPSGLKQEGFLSQILAKIGPRAAAALGIAGFPGVEKLIQELAAYAKNPAAGSAAAIEAAAAARRREQQQQRQEQQAAAQQKAAYTTVTTALADFVAKEPFKQWGYTQQQLVQAVKTLGPSGLKTITPGAPGIQGLLREFEDYIRDPSAYVRAHARRGRRGGDGGGTGSGAGGTGGALTETALARIAEHQLVRLQANYLAHPGVRQISDPNFAKNMHELGLSLRIGSQIESVRIHPGPWGPGASRTELQNYVNAVLSGNLVGASRLLTAMLQQSGFKNASTTVTRAAQDISNAMKRLGVTPRNVINVASSFMATRQPVYTLASYREPMGAQRRQAAGGDHYWNVTINNPKPETAGSSFVRTMQKIKFHGLTPIETLEF